MGLVKATDSLTGYQSVWKVFLAGPIQGAPEWQYTLPELKNVVWLSPRTDKWLLNDFNHTEQVQWETDALRMANIVIFWIPEEAEHVEGRAYAQTTRFELGENMARGKRIILGAHKEFPGRKYFEYKASKYKNVIGGKVCESLEECVGVLKNYIREQELSKTIYFTSDTHFSSERALQLSYRPFSTVEEMDWTMIERWNTKVNPCDTVYHLGDVGEDWPLEYLTGNVVVIEGNYERDGKTSVRENLVNGYTKNPVEIELKDKNGKPHHYILGHEPSAVKQHKAHEDWFCDFCLFGHIHGRQRIKKFGMDVGVDCSNFAPVSLAEVQFYENAINNGYYDDEVWNQ